jgi:hypothetical protein
MKALASRAIPLGGSSAYRIHLTQLLPPALAVLVGMLSGWASPFAAAASASPEVRIIPAPADCLVPDVAVDSKGVLHMVYGLDHNAWYIRSSDHGRAFTAPVKANSAGAVETKMGERGPKLAVGADGSIHLAWVDEWAPGVKTFVRYSRSLDSAKTFEPLKTLSAMSGVDGATLTADGKGNVVAFWHVMADPKPAVNAATWLHTTRSADNGATFGATEKVQISNLSGLACSMCMMRARAGRDGNAYLAFRSAEGGIRDFYVLKGRITENHFTAVRVNQDNWNLDHCPMCGPELTLAPSGQTLCAFMTRAKVYWATSDPGTTAYRLHVATPANEENEIYPSAIANRKGDVLFLWQVGPMATQGAAVVKWARYDQAGRPTGETGVAGKSFAGTKATAFAGDDDNFYIVTTAKAP